ncbi:MAG: cobalt ECF transporter T component CbiQ [Magnetococcales bacterium]|nr:cobalt ECF transporter T component CbiQ [Magnetococcales bacterium]
MMSPIDRAAHLNRWRHRSLTEKALLTFGMLSLAMVSPPCPTAPIVAVVMTAAALAGARVPVRVWLACALGPAGFLLVGGISLAVQVDAGGIGLTPMGLTVAAQRIVRSLAAVACLLFLALTTPTTDLLAGLRRLGVPAELVEIALLMYRFLFLLADVALAMDAAQAARLGHSTRRRRLRSLGRLVANLLPRALDRARRMETGLAARGWQGEMRVSSLAASPSLPACVLILVVELSIATVGVWLA